MLKSQHRVREALIGSWALIASVALLLVASKFADAEHSVGPAAAQPLAAATTGPTAASAGLSAAANAPPPLASYTLNASLNASEHSITGSGSIRFTNAAATPANELYFHLYLNAFKTTKTLFQRSVFRGARSNRKAVAPGHIEIKELIAVEFGNLDLWAGADRHSPGDPDDETDIRVPLPRPLGPGEILTLQVKWQSQLPELTERSGYVRDFHMVAQWFPKLARREPNGTWAHFAFHPNAEFYADFGDYTVTLDVPANEVLGATGEVVNRQELHGRTISTYHASSVHDFAWTAWPDFLSHDEVIAGVQVRVLYPKAASPLLERELAAVRFALPHFNQNYGRYPYSTLTVVHPPADAEAAGGMEYPTLITTGGTVRNNLFARAIEMVTVHELGHQWFYGLLASNEAASPFLDEGLNSYAEGEAMDSRWGSASASHLWDLDLSINAVVRAQAAAAQHDTAVGASAAEFSDFGSLGSLVYARTETILQSVAGVHGKVRLLAALGSYSRTYRFEHPTTENFLSHMGSELGSETEQALRVLFLERGWLDYSVDELNTAPATDPSKGQWIGDVLIRRHGTVSLPVDIKLLAADGSETRQHWDGRAPWLRLNYGGNSELVGAVVDPDLKLPVDSNLLNNAKMVEPATTPRSFERMLYAAQLLLGVIQP